MGLNSRLQQAKSSASGLVCYSESDQLIGLINASELNKDFTINLCKNIQGCVKKYLNLSVSMGISNIFNNIYDISKAYSEAVISVQNKVYMGKGSIIHINDVDNPSENKNYVYPLMEEKDIVNHIKTLDIDGLKAVLSEIFMKFLSVNTDYSVIKSICIRLIHAAISSVEDMGLNIQGEMGVFFQPHKEIDKYEVINDLYLWVESISDSRLNGTILGSGKISLIYRIGIMVL